MATKANEWNTWKTLPADGDLVVVKIDETEHHGQYFNDGNVQFDDFVLLPGDRGKSVWKPKETKQNETKPNQSKQFALNISVEDLHRYIADGLKNDSGVTVLDMWTNKDEGFIVYGSGLGRVAK